MRRRLKRENRVVVQFVATDDLVPQFQQTERDIYADETCRPCDMNLQVIRLN